MVQSICSKDNVGCRASAQEVKPSVEHIVSTAKFQEGATLTINARDTFSEQVTRGVTPLSCLRKQLRCCL